LDAHRKRQQSLHPDLTLTDMYNVLEKLRSGEALTAKEKGIHEQGLVSVLRQLHDELDRAVFAAYGWPADLTDEQILERLVALNAERAAEEARGLVRWLRPEFQNPQGAAAVRQPGLELTEAKTPAAAAARTDKVAWPKTLPEQVQAVRAALAGRSAAVTADELAATFSRAKTDRVEELLETLASLGQARAVGDGRFVA
jgi:hypothetical protein